MRYSKKSHVSKFENNLLKKRNYRLQQSKNIFAYKSKNTGDNSGKYEF